MKKEELLSALNIESVTDLFDEVYGKAVAEYAERGVFFLTEDFLSDIQEKYHPFYKYYDFVKEMRARVAAKPVLCIFSLTLYKMLELNRDRGNELIRMFPRKPLEVTEDEVDFEFTGFFAQLAFAPEMADFYISRGLPKVYFSETLTDMFEVSGIYAYSLTVDRLGYNNITYFWWNQYYINHKIVRIGQLNFEIDRMFGENCIALRSDKGEYKLLAYNKGVTETGQVLGTLGDEKQAFFADFAETEDAYEGYEIDTDAALITTRRLTLPKKEWTVAIRPGDNFLNVHIPRSGKIDRESNLFAYREALRLHRIMFPDRDFKAIGCSSWLVSPKLGELLPETSNIVAFMSGYRKYPVKTQGQAVFGFLFTKKVQRYEDLPEDTSLRRAVKKLYMDGGAVIEAAGLIFPDDI